MTKEMNQVKILEKHFNNYLEIIDAMLLLKLKRWRKNKSKELKTLPYLILHDKDLIAVVKAKPKDVVGFLNIKGFGFYKTFEYGEEIISIVNKKYLQ